MTTKPKIIMPGEDQVNWDNIVSDGEMQTMEMQGVFNAINRKLGEMYVMERDYKISLENAYNLIELQKRMIMKLATKLDMVDEMKKLQEEFEQERINRMHQQ